ncbi:MAG: Spermine/spermidine acetyltransferase [Candidatus Heimdallarchaeota archaeon LC_3]|nr:MAG: Spermine/spermidine acetyltransferase [Candidatus Heimdallarchaeota archaeon LC_3]
MIKLVDLTKNNWKLAIKLDVYDSQKKYIASNIYSIAESTFHKGTILKGIQNGSETVGFVLCWLSTENKNLSTIVRFMIGKDFQGKGYGKIGLELLIKMFKEEFNRKLISLSVIPENNSARKFYEKIGFENTSKMVEGELKYIYKINY